MKKGWEVKKLGEICTIARGGSPRPIKNFITNDPNGINWIKIGDTERGGRYIDSTAEKIKPDGVSRSRFVKAGSFLLSNSMSFGRPYILRTDGCIHDGWLALDPDYGLVDQDFLYHVLSSEMVFSQFDRLAAGSTVRNLNIALVQGVEIPLPPLEEQQRIVAILDEAFEGLDRARANAEANLQNARELFDTAVSEIFAKVETSVSDQINMGEIAEFRNGLNFTRASKGESVKIVGVGDFKEHFTVPIETLSDIVVNGTLSIEDCLQEGDLLAVRSNGNRELIGRTMIVPALTEKVSFSGFTIRIRLTMRRLLPEYLCELMRTKPMRRLMIEGGGGANISNLNQKILACLPISVPNQEAQKVALDSLELVTDRTSTLIEAYKTKIADIAELRQSLLQKAFSGELT